MIQISFKLNSSLYRGTQNANPGFGTNGHTHVGSK